MGNSYDPLPPRCRLGRPDPLEGALNRYSAAFPEAGPCPFLRGIGGAGGRPGGEAVQGTLGLRHRAVATNEPLGRWAIMAALDICRLPDDPFTGGEPDHAHHRPGVRPR